jgi:hypothetical protein
MLSLAHGRVGLKVHSSLWSDVNSIKRAGVPILPTPILQYSLKQNALKLRVKEFGDSPIKGIFNLWHELPHLGSTECPAPETCLASLTLNRYHSRYATGDRIRWFTI